MEFVKVNDYNKKLIELLEYSVTQINYKDPETISIVIKIKQKISCLL